MGSGPSKPAPSSTEHVFTSETPVRFSQDLVDALQASPETDSTRAKDLELHIQSRVSGELARLDASATKALQELSDSISSSPDSTTTSIDTAAQAHMPDSSTSHGGSDHTANAEADRMRELSRASVQKEIEMLKEKLQRRKVREDVAKDEGVERAREGVVRCLRVNDRRPLDCWREVESFKREVGRLEGEWIGRVLE